MDTLDLNQPYGIGEAGFAVVVAELERVNPRTIVEFGSGMLDGSPRPGIPACPNPVHRS